MKKIFTLIAAAFVAISVSAGDRTTLWEGAQVMDGTWPSVQIENTAFATAKDGDLIVVTISKADNGINTEWEWGPQLFINVTADKWENLTGAPTAYPAVSTEQAEYTFMLTQEGLDQIAAGTGIAVQGMNVEVIKVELESSAATEAIQLELVEGHTILAESFDAYDDDVQVKISMANNTDPYESRNGWGIGGFANADNWDPTYALKGLDGATFDIYVTVGDFKTAAKNGKDDYEVSQYDRAGVTFNIYNDCVITGVYVLSPVENVEPTDPADAINTVKTVKAENNVMYNLAGQQVTPSYKGVVIMNGKKFVNK